MLGLLCSHSQQSWKTDIMELEKMQKSLIKMISGLEQLSYKDRLRHIMLFSLGKGGVLIQTYKSMHSVRVDRKKIVFLSSGSWSYPLKLMGGKFRTNKRKYFVTEHIIKLWNSLPHYVVTASSWKALKGEWTDLWRIGLSVVTNQDGSSL